MPEAATIGGCAAYARGRLPRFEADLLVCGALDIPRSRIYAFAERVAGAADARRVRCWVARRRGGEPLAYILGQRGFWGLDLAVTKDALIPRPDTETLVAAALPLISDQARVLDLGTGSGAVALAIAAERPAARVVASDIDPRCLALCRRNAARLGLALETRLADGFNGVAGKFNAIVSNPPYVAADDEHLRQGDLRFEPRRALVGGATGLEFIAALIRAAPRHLEPGGWLCLEHGDDQAPAVRELYRDAGFGAPHTRLDLERRPRATVGQIP